MLRYSFLYALIIIIISFLFYITGNYGKQRTLHFILLLITAISIFSISLIVFSLKNNGGISLSDALKIGVSVSVLGGLMPTFWEILLLEVIEPELISQLAERQFKRNLENKINLNQSQLKRKIELIKKVKSPAIMIAFALIEDLIVGFLFSLIGWLIIRKKRIPID